MTGVGHPDHARTPGWGGLAAGTLARAYLAFGLALAAVGALPAVGTWQTYLVLTESMQPAIDPGDLVVVSPLGARDVPLGRVVSFAAPSTDTHGSQTVIHRVVSQRSDGTYTTAGDANPQDDSAPLAHERVTGQARLLVPWIGLPLLWWRQRRVGPLLMWVVLTALAVTTVARGTPHGTPHGHAGPGPVRHRPPRAPVHVHLPRLPRLPRPHLVPGHGFTARAPSMLSAGVVVVLLAAPTSIGSAFAAFSARTTASGNSWGASTRILQPYTSAVLTDHPWGYYPLDETAGPTMRDLSGSTGRSGTFTAPITYHQPGGVTSGTSFAVTLAGSGARAVAATVSGATAGPTTFSLELWFRTTTTAGGKLLGFESTTAATSSKFDRHVFMRTDGKLTYGGWGSAKTLTTSAAYNNGAWHHLVITTGPSGSNQQSVIYVDGVSVASGVTSAVTSYNGYWRIGFGALATGSGYPTSANFAGTIDNVAIYSTALTAARVAAHYAAR